MKLKHRAGLILLGAVLVCYGLTQLDRSGVFPYPNWQRQSVFPAGVIALGIIFAAFAFLPTGEWMNRLLKGKERPIPRVLRKSKRVHH